MKPKTIQTIITAFGWLLFGISAIFAVIFYFKVSDDAEIEKFSGTIISWAYILGGLAAVLAFIIVPIFTAFQKPKSLVKFLISLGIFAIVVLIAFSMADASGVPDANPKVVLWSDVGLITFYILSVIGILVILGAEIKSMFNK